MPSRTTSDQSRFYYLYVLESQKDGNRYIGMTKDLRKRLLEHQQGKSVSTAPRRPFSLIYYEACLTYTDTKQREKYMKTTEGRRFITKRLRHFYSMRNPKLS
jgi:putative endonuclease